MLLVCKGIDFSQKIRIPAILEGFSEFAEGEAVFMDSRKF
jgi:hypothetical protein